ncbi:MAG: RNA 2',3'-cyclic phosphodiesterase, partial [Mycobacterium sp.]
TSMRLFVALVPPDSVTRHLEPAVAPLRELTPNLRWSNESAWHLTCAFFGEVAETRIVELQQRLGRAAARHDSMPLQFRGAGAFARPARATVLFVGVETELPPITALAASCSAAGRRIGLAVDDHPYRPHLTVARAKGREPVDMRSVVEELAGYAGPRWTASEICLIRSHLGPTPWYETLSTWQLGTAK